MMQTHSAIAWLGPHALHVGAALWDGHCLKVEEVTGERSSHSPMHFSIINLKAGGSAPVRSAHYLKEPEVLKCPSTASTEQSQITHPYPPSYEDVQNTSLLCRTGFPLPHRHCMALYLAQTPLSEEKDTLKFLQHQSCQTNFLIHPALTGFGTEEGELAEHQHQQASRVCDRRARQIVETHQVSTIKHGSHSIGLVSCSGCVSTICHIAQTNLGPCLLKAS